MSKKKADVIVIGSGISGSSTAMYCAKRGLSVIVLEKDDIIANGASGRNGGGVRASGRDIREIPLAKYAIEEIWPTLGKEIETDIEYEQGGNLRIAAGGKQYEDILFKIAEDSKKVGLELEVLNKRQTLEKCKYLSDNVTMSTYCPIDGHCNPLKTSLGIYKKARKLGVQYITGEKVLELQKERGHIKRVITESGNEYEADNVVVCSGYESRKIVNTVGLDLPFRQKLIEIFVTEPTKPMFDFMMSSADGAFYGQQTKHGSVIFGGNSGYEHHPIFREERRTLAQTAPAIARGVMEYFPDFENLKIIRTWSGWIDLSLDLVPVIGPTEEVPGLYIGAGYSAHGFCLGPVTGKIFSELIAGEKPCVDYTALSLDRFESCQ